MDHSAAPGRCSSARPTLRRPAPQLGAWSTWLRDGDQSVLGQLLQPRISKQGQVSPIIPASADVDASIGQRLSRLTTGTARSWR
jgi:hypothetical protein